MVCVDSKAKEGISNLSCGLAASDGLLTSDIEGNDSGSSMNDSDIDDTLIDDEDLDDCPGISSMSPISSPLYDNAEISVFESHLLSFQFAIRHSLTTKAFSELLQLSVHLPSSSMAPRSIYRLKSFFVDLFPHASPSSSLLCILSLLSEEEFCPTEGCQGGAKEFISIALAPQLRRIFEGKGVHNNSIIF